MQDWIDELFKRTGKDAEHKPVFEQVFWNVFDGIEADFGINPFLDKDALLEEGDPECGTLHSVVEEDSISHFEAFFKALKEKHSHPFAVQVALKMRGNCGEFDAAKGEAFVHISTSCNSDMNNPAYAEAYETCLRQEKSEHYAYWCAENIIDARPSWKRCCEWAEEYDKLIQSQLKQGKPLLVAKEYAFQVNDGMTKDFAELYADQYGQQLALGKDERYAAEYARKYFDMFESFGSCDEDESDNFDVELRTEGYMLGKLKGYDADMYSYLFANAYFGESCPKLESHEEAKIRAEKEADAEAERRRQGLPPTPVKAKPPFRSSNPHFEVLFRIFRETEEFINNAAVDADDDDSFHKIVEDLEECIPEEEIEHHMEQLPSDANESEAELDAALEVETSYRNLFTLRDAKLCELGYDPD